jgi:hypothetical protein
MILLSFSRDGTSPFCIKLVYTGTALFLLLGVWEKAQEMPTIWDSDAWAIQMDTAMGLWLLSQCSARSGTETDRSKVFTEASQPVIVDTIRDMFASYYFAAAFWKFNSHFLDPDASCATMFIVQMVVNYLRPILMTFPWLCSASSPQESLIAIAAVAKAWAPISALVVEFAVGGCMVLGSIFPKRYHSHKIQALGSLLALGFHLMVCFLPAPNDISGFALNCAPRHIVFSTAIGTTAALELVQQHLVPFSVIVAAVFAFGIQSTWTENNWAFFLYVLAGGFVALSIVMGASAHKNDEGSRKLPGEKSTTSKRRPMWSYLAVAVAVFYSFGTLMLGLQEESTANMFANLKAGHGGTNHYLLPTGLLFHWFADALDTHPFGGGVIRIENTTSDWLRTVYPADLTAFLQPHGIVKIMEDIGSPPPIYFNPGANRNLGLLSDVPEQFFRYTIPALEFKRLLHEAKERDKDFSLTYSKLPGTRGDEVWRTTATEKVVAIEVSGGAVQECKIYMNDPVSPIPCSKGDLPYVDFVKSVPWILRHISLYHAYPIFVDDNADANDIPISITCFGP